LTSSGLLKFKDFKKIAGIGSKTQIVSIAKPPAILTLLKNQALQAFGLLGLLYLLTA